MRAVVSLVARYRSPTTFEYANESCSDVSVGGMFITSAAPAPAGTLLKLECETDSGNSEAKIRGVARVVWLRREASEHGPSGMGVKFVKLEAGSRELIEEIVARLAEAGVQARSVSAAPEHRLVAAAGGGASASFNPEPAAPSPVKLVPSSPPAAAEGGELPQRGGVVATAKQATGDDQSAATESRLQPAAAATDDLQPRAANEAAEALEEGRSSLSATGSSRPPAPKPSRFGWKFWAAGIVLVLIAIAIADRRGFGPEKTPVTPESPTDTAAPPSPAPQPSAATPTPAPQAVAVEPAEPKSKPKPEPEPAAAAPQLKAAEPAAEPAAEAKPEAPAAKPEGPAATPEAPAAEPVAASTTEPLYPSVAGHPDYVVDFVSQPNAATVTIDEKATLVTPATINLGSMPDRIKVTAKKPGFKSSSIWMKRDGFELKAGVLKRRAYITLKADPTAEQ
jgi:hypothetical protein